MSLSSEPTDKVTRVNTHNNAESQSLVNTDSSSAPDSTETWLEAKSRITKTAISIGVAVAAYGVSFGALGVTSGLSVWQTVALSALMFTGASQFTFVTTIASGGTALASTAAALLMGTRNAAYSARMSTILHLHGVKKLVGAQLTIDESTALGLAQDESAFDGKASRFGFWAGGISVYVLWNAATLLGAVSVSAIGDPKALGLDAAIGAGLYALVWPQIKDRLTFAVGLGGAIAALTLTPVLPAGVPVLAAAVVAFIVGWASGSKSN